MNSLENCVFWCKMRCFSEKMFVLFSQDTTGDSFHKVALKFMKI